jgi:hypothetical protein
MQSLIFADFSYLLQDSILQDLINISRIENNMNENHFLIEVNWKETCRTKENNSDYKFQIQNKKRG